MEYGDTIKKRPLNKFIYIVFGVLYKENRKG